MRSHVTVSEIGRQYKILPRWISDLFYNGKLDDNRCIIVGGRRLIPADYVPEIVSALRAAGRLPQVEELAHA